MSTNMEEKPVPDSGQINPLGHLTRQQLKELEQKEKTRGQKILDFVIMVLPVICGFIAIIEYWEVPNGSPNSHPYTYVWVVAAFMTAYALYALEAGIKNRRGHIRCQFWSRFSLAILQNKSGKHTAGKMSWAFMRSSPLLVRS